MMGFLLGLGKVALKNLEGRVPVVRYSETPAERKRVDVFLKVGKVRARRGYIERY